MTSLRSLSRRPSLRVIAVLCALSFGAAACGPAEEELAVEEDAAPDGDFWQAGDAEEPPEIGKADAILGARALPKSADVTTTAVWEVKRQWSDKVNADFNPYFKKAAGITWNEAFRVFIDKLESTQSTRGYKSYKLTNPWGKTLPIPALECAEQAMFLRVTFSAWFNLPFFIEAIDGSKVRVFAGHMGFRTLAGRYKNFNEFKKLYKDYSATAKATAWPRDEKLRLKKLGYDDDQSGVLGTSGAVFGAYLDELHANKRVGHFTMLMLVWFGSVNLADPANTFHIKPETTRPGDVLLERWQRAGIGHTLNVKRVTPLAGGKLSIELASGSMPRRQALWESAVSSRRYFTLEYMGGPGNADDGTEYAKLGGGIRRWRVPVTFNNSWVNMVPGDSSAAWINSTDIAAIAARPAKFEEILDVQSAAVRRTDLKASLAANRQYQLEHPASCSNREKREALLDGLAELESEERGLSYEETEREYRTFEDYVFPKLRYEKSKTCCWNSTTAEMGDIVMKYNIAQQNLTQQCRKPTPMAAVNSKFDAFKTYAASIGRAAAWKDWSEDEPCPQRVSVNDEVLVDNRAVDFCEIRNDLP